MLIRLLKFLKDWLPARLSWIIPDIGGVYQATLDPAGPGVVRIHLKERQGWFRKTKAVLHLNGVFTFALNPWEADLVRIFIEEICRISKANHEIPDNVFPTLKASVARRLKRLYPLTPTKVFIKDIESLGALFLRVAKGDNLGELPQGLTPEDAQNQSAPDMVDLVIKNITSKSPCNLHCPVCYAMNMREIQVPELSIREWHSVTGKLWRAGVSRLTLTGGEPLLYAGLIELLLNCREFITRLNTNGVLLTTAMAKQLVVAELDGVQITLYSHDPATHEECVATRNVFDKTVAGIRNALAEGLNVSVNVPLVNGNIDQFVDTLRFLAELGVHYVTCSGLIRTGNAVKVEATSAVTLEKLRQVLGVAKKLADEIGLELDFNYPICPKDLDLKALGFNQTECAAGNFKMAIAPNGDVLGCQSDLNGTPYGNLVRDSWSRIWNSPRVKLLRQGTKCPKCGGYHCSCPFEANTEVNHVDAK